MNSLWLECSPMTWETRVQSQVKSYQTLYNALLHNCIEPKIKKILRKNQNGFQRNQSTTLQILTVKF